ncbi:Carbonic anhydrase [Venustampulla echinocandica]|uniref:Carbonic anhydrase n=1 Tax=Venustampulla echinocandica TaxID=2656787 RepID=A0A370TVE3_9HELO|nr:Carbonic anhydrase [Venustampulla echinocandica]RDL39469.1 Carbonic anhydrase [Venustampulla echinocandica]
MGSHSQDQFEYALKSNDAWANYKGHQNPAFFPNLAKGQSPSILWLGCSDSRVPETTLLGLQPGDIFTHRNIANILSPTDLNFLSVLEYAVCFLKVSHIVLCGHTSCGGCAGALSDTRIGGVLDAWLTPLKVVRLAHKQELDAIKDDNARSRRLSELNVQQGVEMLMGNYTVQEAIKERGLKIHGVLYDIAVGKIGDLGFGNSKGANGVLGINNSETEQVVSGNHGMLVFKGDVAQMTVK